MTPNHRRLAMATIIVLAAAMIPLLIQDEYILHTLTLVVLLAYFATSWNLIGGYAGQLSFAHPAFLGIGAYTSSILLLRFSISPWLGMMAGSVIALVVAVCIGLPCFRLRGPFFALATIAFLEVCRILALNARDLTGGARGLLVSGWGKNPWMFQFPGYKAYYYISLALLLLALFVVSAIERSKLGYYLLAIRENEDAASSVGVNPAYCKLLALGISALLTSVGGTVYAQFSGFIEPDVVLGMDMAVEFIVLSIVGGLGTAFGPLIGAIVLVPISEYLRGSLGGTYAGLHLLVYGVVLAVVILFAPAGLLPWMQGKIRLFISRHKSRVLDGQIVRVG